MNPFARGPVNERGIESKRREHLQQDEDRRAHGHQAKVLGRQDSDQDEGADEAQGTIQASYGHHPRRARKKDPTKVSHPSCGR